MKLNQKKDLINNMRKLFISICVLCSILLTACAHSSEGVSHKRGDKKVVAIDTPRTCEEIVSLLIRESKFSSPLVFNYDSLIIDIEDVINNVMTIHISQLNEEKRNVTVAWLELNLATGVLNDVTMDPDNPIQIQHYEKDLTIIRRFCSR